MAVSAAVVISVEWALLVLSLSFVGIRLYVRFIKIRSAPVVADYLIVSAWIFCLGSTVVDQMLYKSGIFTANTHYLKPNSAQSVEAPTTPKIIFASAMMYDLGIFFPKFSLLAQCYQWISPVFPKLRMGLHCITVYVCCACVVVLLIELLWCRPLKSNWSLDNSKCHLLSKRDSYTFTWSCNISSDVPIFVLPFFLLRYLSVGRGVYLAALGVFLLGFITILTTVARYTIVLFFAKHVGLIYILYGLEFNISIIVVCLPSLKVFFKERSASQSTNHSNAKSNNNSMNLTHIDVEDESSDP